MIKKICILIPAYNPPESFVSFVKKLSYFNIDILIVNDGSKNLYKNTFNSLCLNNNNIKIINHSNNLGKGRAIKTGIGEIIKKDYTHIITADADGQHRIADIINISKLLNNKKNIYLGTRSFNSMTPLRSRLGNIIISNIFLFITGTNLQDTQTGLRAFPRSCFEEFQNIPYEKYDYELAVILYCIKHKIEIIMIKIETIYISGNESSHFRPIIDSLKILLVLFKNRIN